MFLLLYFTVAVLHIPATKQTTMYSCLDANCDTDQEIYQRDIDDVFPNYKRVDNTRSDRNFWKRLQQDIKVLAEENKDEKSIEKAKKLFLPIAIIAGSAIVAALISKDSKKKLKHTSKFNRNFEYLNKKHNMMY